MAQKKTRSPVIIIAIAFFMVVMASACYFYHLSLGLRMIVVSQNDAPQEQSVGKTLKLCNEKLDELDTRFNLQRSNRQEYVEERMPEGKVKLFDQFEPESVCFSEERFGSSKRFHAFHDGPKFVCGVDYIAKQPSCLVYSVGCNNNFDFEVAVKNSMGCDIHTFDPTLDEYKGDPNVTTFHDWGLGEDGIKASRRGKIWTSMSFATIIDKLGHNKKRIDIIKIDCEGPSNHFFIHPCNPRSTSAY
jgi:hypothetical protein